MDPADITSTTTVLYDIYDTWFVPFWKTHTFLILLYIFTFIIVGMIGFLIIHFIHKKTQKKILDPWDHALDQLKTIESSDALSVQDRYYMLTSTLKHYIQDRYKIIVQGKTDKQLISFIKMSEIPSSYHDKLCTVLDRAEMIKFSQNKSHDGLLGDGISIVWKFIEGTIPGGNNSKT